MISSNIYNNNNGEKLIQYPLFYPRWNTFTKSIGNDDGSGSLASQSQASGLSVQKVYFHLIINVVFVYQQVAYLITCISRRCNYALEFLTYCQHEKIEE